MHLEPTVVAASRQGLVFAARGLGLFTLLWVAALGCASSDTALDCHGVCTLYSDCFDRGFEVTACEVRCRAHAASDASFRRGAEACSECAMRVCGEPGLACADSCAQLGP